MTVMVVDGIRQFEQLIVWDCPSAMGREMRLVWGGGGSRVGAAVVDQRSVPAHVKSETLAGCRLGLV